ncbi:hypothetical protein HW932_19925 [Allochromatium humboldtianum]|uniref:Uncharacterized protein n=1 Tax=Allochromatium humboldtianum TaxID=504901 RepID=A0A850RK91_9GAMM|nr:hypothetical protein [Allochromatium humboldtianum]NVZ11522.1 hypothetical protein [Allochromatium humboldtianum]
MPRPTPNIHITSADEDAALTDEDCAQIPPRLRRGSSLCPSEQPAPTTRAGWFDGYRAEDDPDAWADLPIDADPSE